MKKSLNGTVFKALRLGEMSLNRVPMLLMSGPGAGKTTSVEMFAEMRGYELVVLRGNSTSAEEILGYGVAPSDLTSEKIKEIAENQTLVRLRPRWFQKIVDNHAAGKRTLLFLDEITTAPESVQSALLYLVFEKAVDEEKLPEDTLVVAAGNYSQNLGSEMNMLPPLMNRFCIINLTFTIEDLEFYLNRFDGAIQSDTGTPNNRKEKISRIFKELDEVEKSCETSQEFKNRAGEYFQRVIIETTKQLVSKQKLVDLNARDLSSLFNDMTEHFTGLLGFITPRTLNYLLDACYTMYSIYGKEGIQNEDFRNVIDGLCGVGITTDEKGNTKINYIGDTFFSSISSTINDIEKMKNNSLKEYEDYLKGFVKSESLKDTKFKFDVPTLTALRNKLCEIYNSKSITNIERPISADIISSLISLTARSQKNSKPGRVAQGKTPDVNKLGTEIYYFNELSKFLGILHTFVTDNRLGYKEDCVTAINDAKKENGGIAVMFKAIKAVAQGDNNSKSQGIFIPEIIKAGSDVK